MFKSEFLAIGKMNLPQFSGTRIQMMPVEMGNLKSLPPSLSHWAGAVKFMFALAIKHPGIGYLTIDEREVPAGQCHRRPGLHVDGMGAWGKGGGGWGVNGMLTVSNVAACAAWNQKFEGEPLTGEFNDEDEGNCEHLRSQCREDCRFVLKPNWLYWCSGMCVHESLPLEWNARRTFVRLSMPSDAEWPSNCTPNPLGIKPGGPIGNPRSIGGIYSY